MKGLFHDIMVPINATK